MDRKTYQTVILAGLLHDIGKLMMKGDFPGMPATGKHPELSRAFVELFRDQLGKVASVGALAALVEKHHESRMLPEKLRVQSLDPPLRPLGYLVSRADNYSSSERGERATGWQDYRTVPLVSIFSRVSLDGRPPAVLRRYRVRPIASWAAFPEDIDRLDSEEARGHLGQMSREIHDVMAQAEYGFDALYARLLGTLEKYAWCFPSDSQEEVPDVSLYDHLKTTSAIAACLFRYHDGAPSEKDAVDDRERKFVMVAGDVSGIQSFIYSGKSIGARGATKRLRARSFLVSLVSEITCHRILRAFDLPISCKLASAGGKFYCLIPRLEGYERSLRAIQESLDEWSVSATHSQLAAYLAWRELSGDGFAEFGEVLSAVVADLGRAKRQPLHTVLADEGGWLEPKFLLGDVVSSEDTLCPACGAAAAAPPKSPGDEPLCASCDMQSDLGRILPRTFAVAFHDSPSPGAYAWAGGYFSLIGPDGRARGRPYLVSVLKNDAISSEPQIEPAGLAVESRRIANFIPVAGPESCDACPATAECGDKRRAGEPLTFACLSEASTGRKALGWLKADVDDLGRLIRSVPSTSISRLSTFSRMLDLFFGGYVDYLMRGEKGFRLLYTVYSGGDDLLVVGPWDTVARFAEKLVADFRRFTGENASITISAGLVLSHDHTPVAQAAEAADSALEEAKTLPPEEADGAPPKNQICAFGHRVNWEVYDDILEEAARVAKWLEAGAFSKSFVRTLHHCGRRYLDFTRTRDASHLVFIPMLAYAMARNIPQRPGEAPEVTEAREWAQNFQDLNDPLLPHLQLVAECSINLTRGGGK